MDIRRVERIADSLAGGSTRRTVLRGLGGGGFAVTWLVGTGRRAAAHGVEDVAREAMEAVNQALATGDTSGWTSPR